MSRSTLLLLRFARFRISLGLVKMAILGTLLGAYLPLEDHKLGWIPIMVAMLGASIMMLPTLFKSQIAPVTNRQIAWIPLGVFAAMALTGILFQSLAQFWRGMPPAAFVAYWQGSIPLAVFAILFGMLLWRLFHLAPGLIGLIGFASFLPQIPHWLNPERLAAIDAVLAFWPLALAGIAFVIWEGPRQWEMLSHMAPITAIRSRFAAPMPDLLSPSRPHWATRLADAASFAIIAGAVGIAIWGMTFVQLKLVESNPFLLFLLFILILPVSLLVRGWRQNRASGMRYFHAALVLILRATLVLEPFRDKLGVRAGAHLLCDDCRNWRFAWQKACPHCASRERVEKPLIPIEATGFLRGLRYDWLAMTYRVIAPGYVAIFILFRNFSRWFLH